MEAHVKRFREATKQPYFLLRLSKSAIYSLAIHAGDLAAPSKQADCDRLKNTMRQLAVDGLLDPLPLETGNSDRTYEITGAGEDLAAVLRETGLMEGTPTDPESVDLSPDYAMFRESLLGDGMTLRLSRSSITALRHFKATPNRLLGCRRQRDACVRLQRFGLLTTAAETDEFGRENYAITNLGEYFDEILTKAGFLPALPIAKVAKTKKALRRSR